MIKREESSWSVFQGILLGFAVLMLLGGLQIIVAGISFKSYGVVVGLMMLGLGLILIVCWYFLHRSAKRSMVESYQMSETKYLEKLQKRARRGARITFFCTAFLVIFTIYHSIEDLETTDEMVDKIIQLVFLPIFFGVCGFALLYWTFCHIPYNKFSRYFKERYVLEVLQTNDNFNDLSYQLRVGYDMDEVSRMNMFSMGDRACFKSEDTLKGRYKGRFFTFGDVKTGRIDEVGKLKCRINLFRGQVATFDGLVERKESDGLLLVRDRSITEPANPAVELIHTENIAFQDKFEVYAEKPLNAFYHLTPPFIEKIMEVSERLEGQLSLCFYQHTIYAAVNSGLDIFDPKIDVDLREEKERLLNKDVKLIMEIVDILIGPQESYAH